MQRVFGFSQRLPNSLLSDDLIDPQYLSENPHEDFARSEKLRQAATRAWAALDNRSRLLKVFKARHRVQQTFAEGEEPPQAKSKNKKKKNKGASSNTEFVQSISTS